MAGSSATATLPKPGSTPTNSMQDRMNNDLMIDTYTRLPMWQQEQIYAKRMANQPQGVDPATLRGQQLAQQMMTAMSYSTPQPTVSAYTNYSQPAYIVPAYAPYNPYSFLLEGDGGYDPTAAFRSISGLLGGK